jgi:hypothetical protein
MLPSNQVQVLFPVSRGIPCSSLGADVDWWPPICRCFTERAGRGTFRCCHLRWHRRWQSCPLCWHRTACIASSYSGWLALLPHSVSHCTPLRLSQGSRKICAILRFTAHFRQHKSCHSVARVHFLLSSAGWLSQGNLQWCLGSTIVSGCLLSANPLAERCSCPPCGSICPLEWNLFKHVYTDRAHNLLIFLNLRSF